MANYQAIARRYRPQRFSEVLGQEAIVTTLKNGMRMNCLAHAYLFAGARGTGKTTLARLLAKALNCEAPTEELEPCNACSSCREISQGTSLNVLEIDGASHRGIDDIRQLTENVGYATAGGKYKIYIIDEVHMLTKEAFNGLLKTLEEPPPHVKFFFATTEPHKVLPTIVSRCQRFHLHRLPPPIIVQKLLSITQELHVQAEEKALYLIASLAEGGMRDAESMLDQVISFHGETITEASAAEVLGIQQRAIFFDLDRAAAQEDFSAAFAIAHQLFMQGKDFAHFLEGLIEHYRSLLLLSLGDAMQSMVWLSAEDLQCCKESLDIYTREQCLAILDYLIEAQEHFKQAHSKQLALEVILLRVIRMRQRVPLDILVKRLVDLEQATKENIPTPAAPVKKNNTETPAQIPTPTVPRNVVAEPTAAVSPPVVKKEESKSEALKKQSRYNTVLRFAAVELDGTVKK